MSWGERSCTKYGLCNISKPEICNVNCEKYIWDKVKEPDSKKHTAIQKPIQVNFRKARKRFK